MVYHDRGKTIALLGSATFSVWFALGVASEASVNRSGFVPIGGIEQWIDIRGGDSGKPVLLVVHGGPGEAQWPVADKYLAWEKTFVIVHWDQRGAGHTYGRYGDKTPDMNLDRIVRDGIEVAQYLCRTQYKKKVIVLGHSWGSIVAVNMVRQRPDLFAAYVGTGQVTSWAASVRGQFALLFRKARADNDQDSIKMFETIGEPDPANAKQYFGFTKNLRAAMAPSDQAWLEGLRTQIPKHFGGSEKDFEDFLKGMDFSAKHVLPDQMATDLSAPASRINIPFFVIQGRDDVITPTSAAIAYFNAVTAPEKKLILIDGAGHFAFLAHSDQFLKVLVQTVFPVAIARGA